jgi:putative membrane protein
MRVRGEKTMDLFIGTLLLRPYVFAFLVVGLAAGRADLGWRRTLGFLGWMWALAWLSEFASTRVGVPFGLYHYTGLTRGQELFIADVPLMDSLSFTFLGYASFALARAALAGRAASRLTLALLAGFLMMLLDVVIDPLAVQGERWFLGPLFSYAEPGVYFGVPLSNFAGWWLVGTAGVGGYLALAGPDGMFGQRRWPGVGLYYAVLGFNLAVTAWIGEWRLLVIGLVLHAVVGLVLGVGRYSGAGVARATSTRRYGRGGATALRER